MLADWQALVSDSKDPRPVRAASAARVRFPRVGAAWRILAGVAPIALATPVLADATVPQGPGPSSEKPIPCANARTEGLETMVTGGVIAMSRAPQAPKLVSPEKGKQKQKEKEKASKSGEKWQLEGVNLHVSAEGIRVHPHGPDEPCRSTRRG